MNNAFFGLIFLSIVACAGNSSTPFVEIPNAMGATEEKIPGGCHKERTPTTVAAMHIFYNNSFYDGSDEALNEADDAALDKTKEVLRPGQTASGSNITNKGINGLMVDFLVDPSDEGTFSPAIEDFQIRTGLTSNPSDWTEGPRPTAIAVRKVTVAGVTYKRVSLAFDNNAMTKTYVQVTALATRSTGLRENTVAGVFGTFRGDADLESSSGYLHVNMADIDITSARFGMLVDSPLRALIKINMKFANFNMTDISMSAAQFGSVFELITLQ